MYLFLLGNKRLLLLITVTSTTRETATEKRAFAYLPLTLRVSVCPRPSVPYCNSKDFSHLGFTDKHTVTIMSLWRTQIKVVQIYWLSDKHTRISVNIIMKSWPSAVMYSFQYFEQEKSVKAEMLFY